MVNFQFKIGKQKKEINLEEISSDESELRHFAEERIKKVHHHSDGSEVVLSAVEPSEMESMIGEKQIVREEKSNLEYGKAVQSASSVSQGIYSSESNSQRMFMCACGAAFHAAGGQQGMQVYTVNEYSSPSSSKVIVSYSNPSGEYSNTQQGYTVDNKYSKKTKDFINQE